MPIHVECPECDRPYDVPDRFAGQKVRCKACGGAIPVPQATAAADDAAFDEPFPAMTAGRQPTRPAATAGNKKASPLAGPLKWWLIGGGVFVLLATLAVSFLTPLGILIAIGLFVIGMLVLTVGQIMLIVTAFNEDATQGLLVFFVPIYPLFYLFSRWPKTSTSVWLYIAGIGVSLLSIPTGLGGMFAAAQWAANLETDDDAPFQQAGNAGGQFGDAAGPNGFPQQPGFIPPDGMPPEGFPPGAFPPGGFPPGAMPGEGFPPPGVPPEAMPAGFDVGPAGGDFDGPPAATTLYLRSTNSHFDRNADHETALEEALTDVEGYVAGSAAIDMAGGIVTFEASRRAAIQVNDALRTIGFQASTRPSPTSWADPTRPKSITLTIRSTLPTFDELTDVDATVDELMTEIDGYVPGSVNVDVDAGQVVYEAFPGTRAERFPLPALMRAGIHTAPPAR